jgi:hypothetical protein
MGGESIGVNANHAPAVSSSSSSTVLSSKKEEDENMGVRVGMALYDSVTDTAFGPVFYDLASAEEFLEWCFENYGDPRKLDASALEDIVANWRNEVEAAESGVNVKVGE